MHAGFGTLRNALPMNVGAQLPGRGWNVAVQDDVDRIVAIWRDCLERSGGPLLFGRFSNADAFYAPIASRFETYAIDLPADAAAYRDRVLALAGMRRWRDGARAEDDFLIDDEPYRRRPA